MTDNFESQVEGLLDTATGAYYSYFFGDPLAFNEILRYKKNWESIHDTIRESIRNLRDAMAAPDAERFDRNLQMTKLIRRWREADHPGENSLVALLASKTCAESPLPAIGIGWGGIELPLVFRHVMRIAGADLPPVFAAHYSKYARSGSREPRIQPLSPEADISSIQGKQYMIFDDNSLSGATLQVVVEYLWTKYRARPAHVFLTKISGERRYDQMRMEKSDRGGLLNPLLVASSRVTEKGLVKGYLGETPFSRSWSRDVYENPIGVFSLSKRRILELLFSNSSADRFDREGF